MSRRFLSMIHDPAVESMRPHFQERIAACNFRNKWNEPAEVTDDLTIPALADRMEDAIRDSAHSLENDLDTNCNMNARVRALEAHNEAQQLR